MAGDRWHSLPMPYDRSVSGKSKPNHHVWLAGHGTVRPTHSTQHDIWVERSHRIDAEEFYRLLEGVVIDESGLFDERLREWEDHYDFTRPHGGLDGQTPSERLRQKTGIPT